MIIDEPIAFETRRLRFVRSRHGPKRRTQSGAALMLALMAAGLLVMMTAVSVDAFLVSARAAQSTVERDVAFHAADTVLTLCEREVVSMHGTTRDVEAAAKREHAREALRRLMRQHAEPKRWEHQAAFDAGFFRRDGLTGGRAVALPIATFPELALARCIAERWIARPGVGHVYLLTVRMPVGHTGNARRGPAVWLQSIVEIDRTGVRRHWRSVAAPPT